MGILLPLLGTLSRFHMNMSTLHFNGFACMQSSMHVLLRYRWVMHATAVLSQHFSLKQNSARSIPAVLYIVAIEKSGGPLYARILGCRRQSTSIVQYSQTVGAKLWYCVGG